MPAAHGSPLESLHTAGGARWRARVLEYIDAHAGEIVTSLSELVRTPSVSGSDEENAIQFGLAEHARVVGLDVDQWQIPLVETLAAPDFPGVEVVRREAWGLVAALWAVKPSRPSRSRCKGELLLGCVQGEEDGGLGTYAMLQRGWRADACVIPELRGHRVPS